MQTLTRMNKEVVEDYYHMTPMNEFELDETNKSIVIFFSLNLRTHFCTCTLTSNKRKFLPLHYVYYVRYSLKKILLTLMFVCRWYEEFTPQECDNHNLTTYYNVMVLSLDPLSLNVMG